MEEKQTFSIHGSNAGREIAEIAAEIIFTVCAFFAVLAVASITIYMFINGMPALLKVGVKELLFGTVWQPTSAEPSFGILYVILTSIIGTALAVLIGAPVGILTAVFIEEIASPRLAAIVKPAVELLAGIPSVIYGLLGIYLLNPFMYKLELALFSDSPSHQFTGGANLLSAIIVLAIMILPTVINVSVSALHAVPKQQAAASLAMGHPRYRRYSRYCFRMPDPGSRQPSFSEPVVRSERQWPSRWYPEAPSISRFPLTRFVSLQPLL